jgi:medium-chain acyl-[acyl-carrier-protein] hydrolase
VAFETARHLRRMGAGLPAALFVSASRAPQLPWPHAPVRQLDDMALLTEVHRRYGSVPSIVFDDAELRTLLTPALRADMSLIETYAYEAAAPFACPVIAFGGDRDPMVGRPELDAWAVQTTGAFQFHSLDGDHLFLQSQRERLLHTVADVLAHSASVRRHLSGHAVPHSTPAATLGTR